MDEVQGMTRDDIMLWAVQARLPSHYATGEPMWPDRLERFASLVAAHTLSNIDPSRFMSYQEGFAAGAAAEREAWRNAAIRVGENLATCGPAGYYDFTSQQWFDWALDATTKMQDDYTQLGACGEREAIAQMIEDAPTLVPLAKNDQGGCVVCGFDPKFAASYIRARGETK